MKKILLFSCAKFVAASLLMSIGASAQDVVYFENGDPLPDTRITSITDEKVLLTRLREGVPKEYPFGRSKILLAFTKEGNYLLVSELSADINQAKQQLQALLAAPPRLDGNDYLVKAVPLTVIPARISYESEELVNYKTLNGNPASISKNELVAILYKDGRHLLTVSASESAPLLADVRATLANGGKPVAAQVIPPAAVQPKPEVVVSPALTPLPAETVVTHTPETSVSAPLVSTDARPRRTLSEEEKESYRQRSLQRVEEFVSYVNIITDKSISSDDKDRAIEQASRLFMANSTIEVTSNKRTGSRKLSVKQYLTRLKLLPYLSTKIEWVQTQFVRDLEQAADGNYYGTIAGQQTFIGYGAGGRPEYSDVTSKNVRVKLQSYQKMMDGQEVDKWRVLLGNVSVEAEQN